MQTTEHSEPRTVFITGTSTGIGQATALYLDRAGYRVFAGVRRAKDEESLNKLGSERLVPIRIDVTEQRDIEASAKLIEEATNGRLHALVNNAGMCLPSVLETVPLSEFRAQLEVNLMGPLALIQTFLPLLRRSRGRIVNVGSVSGTVATVGAAAYSASKFALEAVSDALRLELRPWGILVTIVEPGEIRTAIFEKARDQLSVTERALPDYLREGYLPMYRAMLEKVEKGIHSTTAPDQVAEVIERALRAKRPRARYFVGRQVKLIFLMKRLLPEWALDALIARVGGVPQARP